MSILARGIGAAAEGFVRGVETGQRLKANRYALDEMKRVENAKKRLDEMDAAGPPSPRKEAYPVIQYAKDAQPATGYSTNVGGVTTPTTAPGVPDQTVPTGSAIPQPEGATTYGAPVDIRPGEEVVSTETRTGFGDYASYRDEYLRHASVVGGERSQTAREKFNKADHTMILGVMFQNKVGIMNNDPIAMTNSLRSIAEIRPEFSGMSDRMYIGTDNTMRYQRGDKRSVDDPPVNKDMFMLAMQSVPEVQDYLKAAVQIEESLARIDYFDALGMQAKTRGLTDAAKHGLDTKEVYEVMTEADEAIGGFLANDGEWLEGVMKGIKVNKREFAGVPLRNAEDVRRLVTSISQDMIADNYRAQEPGSKVAAPPPRTPSMVYSDAKHLTEWMLGSKDAKAPEEFFMERGADGVAAYYMRMPSGQTYRFLGSGFTFPMIVSTNQWYESKQVAAENTERTSDTSRAAALELGEMQRADRTQHLTEQLGEDQSWMLGMPGGALPPRPGR